MQLQPPLLPADGLCCGAGAQGRGVHEGAGTGERLPSAPGRPGIQPPPHLRGQGAGPVGLGRDCAVGAGCRRAATEHSGVARLPPGPMLLPSTLPSGPKACFILLHQSFSPSLWLLQVAVESSWSVKPMVQPLPWAVGPRVVRGRSAGQPNARSVNQLRCCSCTVNGGKMVLMSDAVVHSPRQSW